jgi:hypothetical protein
MSIAAANVVPSFHLRRSLVADDLRRLQEPAVIFEYENVDSDGVRFFAYTVAGWLDGLNVATVQGGCTVGGEVILITANTRADADAIAGCGLEDTINALHQEHSMYEKAQEAQARLASIGALERMRLAQAPASDKSDQFVQDADAIRPLVGDDILLTVNGSPPH